MTWKYCQKSHPNNTNMHALLRNSAYKWLLEQGFRSKDITVEACPTDSPGYMVDLLAESSSRRYYVECETSFDPEKPVVSASNYWSGGPPSKNGEAEFLFCQEGVYRPQLKETVTRLSEDCEKIVNQRWQFKRVCALPQPTIDLFCSLKTDSQPARSTHND